MRIKSFFVTAILAIAILCLGGFVMAQTVSQTAESSSLSQMDFYTLRQNVNNYCLDSKTFRVFYTDPNQSGSSYVDYACPLGCWYRNFNSYMVPPAPNGLLSPNGCADGGKYSFKVLNPSNSSDSVILSHGFGTDLSEHINPALMNNRLWGVTGVKDAKLDVDNYFEYGPTASYGMTTNKMFPGTNCFWPAQLENDAEFGRICYSDLPLNTPAGQYHVRFVFDTVYGTFYSQDNVVTIAANANKLPNNCNCTPNWQCDSWGACKDSLGGVSDGWQYRNCRDTNGCTSTRLSYDSYCLSGMPNQVQRCSCTPNWQCSAWSTCAWGLQTRTCADSNNCGNKNGMPMTRQYCPGSANGAVNEPVTSVVVYSPGFTTNTVPVVGALQSYNSYYMDGTTPSIIYPSAGTLQMVAEVKGKDLDVIVDNSNVNWSVSNGTGTAVINPVTGLLTGVTAGTVTVKATSVSNPAASDTKQITITASPAQVPYTISSNNQ